MRAMGGLGIAGASRSRCAYERRVATAEELDALRQALGKLAEYLRPKKAAA
jgi:hypothetical protein